MKEIEITDKRTVEDAIEDGLVKLGIKREDAEIEILSAGGLFSKPKVKLTVKDSAGRRAVKFAVRLVELMNIKAVVELDENEEEAKLDIIGTDIGGLIGYRGEVLDAIQYLSSIVANLGEKETFKRITVDSENYRNKRTETLEGLAERMVSKAVTTGRRVALEPMNPYERRIIHMKLQDNEEVTAHSEGEEPNRRLIIVPKNEKPFDRYAKEGGYNKENAYNKEGGYNKESGYNRNGGRSQDGGQNKGGYNKSKGGFGGQNKSFNNTSGFSQNSFIATSGFSEAELKGGKNYTANTKYNKDKN